MVKPTRNQLLIGIAILVVIAIGLWVRFGNGSANNILSSLRFGGMSKEQIAQKSIDYLNNSVLQNGQVATLGTVSEESGVIKMQIKIGTSTYDSYATRDGKLLFPEAFMIGSSANTGNNNQNNNTTASVNPENVAKVAKTSLEAYVVSGCPFGIQVQRALANAIKNVPSLADYVKVRYIGAISGNTITAMHGTEEANENLRQICIREEQPAKYWPYVSCYIQKSAGTANGMPYGDTKTCQTQVGVDAAKLDACVKDPNRGLKAAKVDFDLNTKFNVQGSPTMILNDQVISEDAFGGRSADAMRNMVCSSSITPPEFCSTKLDTTPATTSFSLTYANPGGATAVANNNCAPVAN